MGDRRIVVEGLAAMAVTLSEMDASEDEARAQLVTMLQRVGATDVGVVREAAAAISGFPQPLDESAEAIERAEPIRRLLDVPSAAEELQASLRAREWLERLADDLDAAQH